MLVAAKRAVRGSAFLLLVEFLVAAEPCSTDGQVRLADGLTANEGRVEICLDGEWGTICDHHWGSSEARIVCQQLGLPAEHADAIYRYGGVSGLIHYAGFRCDGTETQLSLCPADQINSSTTQITNCQHLEDAGVRCTNVPCAENDVRLNEEIVQVCHDQQWGLMCAPRGSWDENAVQVMCTQAGRPSTSPRSPSRRALFYDAPVILNDITCNGTEASIVECAQADYGSFTDCANIAVAHCEAQESCNEPNAIRLTRFSSDTMGRLEVCANGMWGTVCGNTATIALVRVACRQLNHAPGGSLFRESDFAFLLDGLVPIRRTNVVCAGNEDSLSECSFNGADGDPTCTHRDDVIIMCATQSGCNEGDVRLVDGQNTN
ncbi:Neurotrypsin [Geodia barretti]|uniref:Neurotrypsin n=2 Tax=Geodia barretti TaxID=519541 RepID=A0AA35S1K5_GEOBA|nr:Neurotrypsin [Geodia barretti]